MFAKNTYIELHLWHLLQYTENYNVGKSRLSQESAYILEDVLYTIATTDCKIKELEIWERGVKRSGKNCAEKRSHTWWDVVWRGRTRLVLRSRELQHTVRWSLWAFVPCVSRHSHLKLHLTSTWVSSAAAKRFAWCLDKGLNVRVEILRSKIEKLSTANQQNYIIIIIMLFILVRLWLLLLHYWILEAVLFTIVQQQTFKRL